jgi:peptidoglycan DL-endopeptidase CwlO
MILWTKVKQKMKSKKVSLKLAVPLLALTAILTAGFIVAPIVRADRFDAQIQALNNDTAVKSQNRTQLGAQAASISDVINSLQAQINDLQAKINDNQAKNAELQKQIAAAEEELAKQKKLLGENIRAMYLEGQITTLEMLASSKNLSDFVDKQQYRNSVKDKVKTALDKVTALKSQLKSQKATLEKLIADQQAMQQQVAAQQAEQNRLLSLNQAQQADLNNQIRANNAQVSELRRQQIIENARFIGPGGSGPACGGGYPGKWCEIPQDSVIDNWGMYNRECVSYTAFRVAASGRYMPYWGGVGNANQWPDDARSANIPVDGNPRAGDVAISMRGYYGHAMYVESVNGDGTINVSQYNASLDGRYSTRSGISPSGLYFIHF